MHNIDKGQAPLQRVIQHGFRVQIYLTECGNIGFEVHTDEEITAAWDSNAMSMITDGAPFTLVAGTLLARQMLDRLIIETLERTEMRFRRLNRFDPQKEAQQALLAAPARVGEACH